MNQEYGSNCLCWEFDNNVFLILRCWHWLCQWSRGFSYN